MDIQTQAVSVQYIKPHYANIPN